MIKITKAADKDYQSIKYLVSRYGAGMKVYPELINKHDIALQARSTMGECVGFIYLGIMAKGRVGYIDKFIVNPDFTKMGIGNMLAHELLKRCTKRGIKEVFGFIQQDMFHVPCAVNSMKMFMNASTKPYTYVYTDIAKTIARLEVR